MSDVVWAQAASGGDETAATPSLETSPLDQHNLSPSAVAEQGFAFDQDSAMFRKASVEDAPSQTVAIPLPATAGAALAMLACYSWGVFCQRWRRGRPDQS